MSAVALDGIQARRPGWLHTFGAVLAGTAVAWALSLLWLLPVSELAGIAVPQPVSSGHGWPWRIDGPWSLAADLGPLLLMGWTFALGVTAVTYRWTGVEAPRWPLTLTAACVGWVVVDDTPPAGLLPVTQGLAFVAVMLVARESAIRERRRRDWSAARLALVAAIVTAHGAISISYGVLHPLTAGGGEQETDVVDGRIRVGVWLHNRGDRDARVLAVTAPGAHVLRAETLLTNVAAPAVEALQRPVAGTWVSAGEPLDVTLTLGRSACGARIDRLHVRLRIAGRALDQVVRPEQPIVVLCR